MTVAQALIGDCAVAMMQKDEGDVLRAWIDHYTSLFVPDALTIFDNGSTDPVTLSQLQRAERLGIHVDRTHTSAASLEAKGDILLARFRALTDRYAFYYPQDCDELLVCGSPGDGPGELLKNIRSEFDALRRSTATMFRIGREYQNAPGSTGFTVRTCYKVMLRSPLPESMDRGFHFYDFPHGRDVLPGIVPTNFMHVHFHKKPFHLHLRGARQKLKTRVSSFAPEIVGDYRGAGRHLSALFAMPAEEYYKKAGRRADQDLSNWFDARGIPIPFGAPEHIVRDDDPRVVFERRPVNALSFAAESGLGEAAVRLLEPLLWRAGSYLEYSNGGSAASLALASECRSIALIKPAHGLLGATATDGRITTHKRPLLPLRRIVRRFCEPPPSRAASGVVLVDGPRRMAVLSILYGAMKNPETRICVPRFADWALREEAGRLFTVQAALDRAVLLRSKPAQEALAAALFNRYWRDAT